MCALTDVVMRESAAAGYFMSRAREKGWSEERAQRAWYWVLGRMRGEHRRTSGQRYWAQHFPEIDAA